MPAPRPTTLAAALARIDALERENAEIREKLSTLMATHLEISERRIELPDAERRDTDGCELVPIGEERSEKLDFIPARFRKLVIIRVRYGRRDSREPVVTAPLPSFIVERGLATDELVLHIAHAK